MPNSITDNSEISAAKNAGGNMVYLLAGCGIGATLALLFQNRLGQQGQDCSLAMSQDGDSFMFWLHSARSRCR